LANNSCMLKLRLDVLISCGAKLLVSIFDI